MDSRTRLTILGYTLALALTWELGTALHLSASVPSSVSHRPARTVVGRMEGHAIVKCLGWALHLAEDFEVNCVFLKRSREPDQGK